MTIAFGAVIGATFTNGDEGTTIQLTTTATVSSGGFIVVMLSGYNNTTVSGGSTGGLTWATDSKHTSTTDANYYITFLSAQAPSGLASGTVLTFTYSGNTYGRNAWGAYWTGVAATSAKDAQSGNMSGTDSSWATAAVTTTNADDLIVGGAWIDFRQTTNTPAANYTERFDTSSATSGGTHVILDRIVSSTGSYTPGGTWANAGQPWVAGAVAYKAAAVAESYDVDASLTLDLGLTGAVAKTAGTTGNLSLGLTVGGGDDKEANTVGGLLLDLDVAAVAAKIAATIAEVALDLDLAGTVTDKETSTAADLGLTLDLTATGLSIPPVEVSATLGLTITPYAVASKTAVTVGALSLVLAVVGLVGELAPIILGRLTLTDATPARTLTDATPARTLTDLSTARTLEDVT